MVLLRILASLSVGGLASSYFSNVGRVPSHSHVAYATDRSTDREKPIDPLIDPNAGKSPVLDLVMDKSKDTPAVSMVIVGGGPAGARVALQFDSVFDVTLIDEKNYLEMESDVLPLLARKWSEKSEEYLQKYLILHRFYLKRANVLTGTVSEVNAKQVKLSDGRVVDYEILVMAQGEQKAVSIWFLTEILRGKKGRNSELFQVFGFHKEGCHYWGWTESMLFGGIPRRR